jgi:hypothetical protein
MPATRCGRDHREAHARLAERGLVGGQRIGRDDDHIGRRARREHAKTIGMERARRVGRVHGERLRRTTRSRGPST